MPSPLRRAHTAAAVLVAVVSVLACTVASAHATVQPRLIVGFTTNASSAVQADVVARSGSGAKVRIPALRAVVVQPAPGRLAAVRRQLLARPGVAFVEVDHVARAYDLEAEASTGVAAAWQPNDTFYSQQWALATIGADQAWERTRGTGVTIAVLDTGVDYIHPDLAGRIDLGRDFVGKDDDPMDVQGHGTHVSGIVAANADDGFGVAGVAPGARVLAVRVLDEQGAGNYSTVADGIVYAAKRGAKVINLSLGGPERSELLHAAIDYAAARGAIVTCATGNDGARAIGYPARYESCLAVGASDVSDSVADFSNQGAGIDLVAPGAGILSSTMGGSHDSWDGTSMATPYAAGVAALLYSQGLGRREVLAALTSTAKDIDADGPENASGAGRIDAAAATEAASRSPRRSADTTAPTVTAITLLPRRELVRSSAKTVWKLRKRTGFTRVGTTDYRGAYAYSKVSLKGAVRTTQTFRFRGGVVYRSTLVQVRTKVVTRLRSYVVPVQVTAADDVAVDRVALELDGRVVGVDWTAAGGWTVEVPCTTGAHSVVASAFDVADNEGAGSSRLSLRC